MFNEEESQIDFSDSGAFIASVLSTDDPKILREMVMNLLVITGYWYKRSQTHVLLHPVFFLTGFAAAYFFMR